MNIKKLPDLMKINIEGSEGNVVASIPKKFGVYQMFLLKFMIRVTEKYFGTFLTKINLIFLVKK